jgi:hypothetical protein
LRIQLLLRGNSRTPFGEYTIGYPDGESHVCLSLLHTPNPTTYWVVRLGNNLKVRRQDLQEYLEAQRRRALINE